MISIRKTATELDRLDELLQVTAECYRLAIRSSGQYAVEITPEQAESFRRHLDGIQDRLQNATSAQELQAVQASYRGELRTYHDQASEQLASLRAELHSAATAMQAFANSVTTAGDDHEKELKAELEDLETATRSEDLDELRKQVHQAASAISRSVEQMRRSNQLVVAQLCDEIRLLHKEIESEKRIASVDSTLGVWNRQKMESRVDDLLRQKQPFWFLHIRVRNLRRLESEYTRAIIDGGLKALLQRLGKLVESGTMIGRWSEDGFAAILETDPANSIPLSRTVARKLSGTYSVQENGAASTIAIQATSGIIDCSQSATREIFDQKVMQLTATLAGA